MRIDFVAYAAACVFTGSLRLDVARLTNLLPTSKQATRTVAARTIEAPAVATINADAWELIRRPTIWSPASIDSPCSQFPDPGS